MSHIEPDDLATLALDGGRPEGVTRAHLDECVECRTEYEALARTVELGRGAAEQELESPPSSVWAAIHGELALSPDLAADPLVSPRGATTAPEPDGYEPPRARVTPISDAPVRPAGGVPADDAAPGTRRRWWPIAIAAAAAGIVAGIAVGATVAGLMGSRPESQTVVASASLDAFPGWSTAGSAVVEEDDDGVRSIVVEPRRTGPGDGGARGLADPLRRIRSREPRHCSTGHPAASSYPPASTSASSPWSMCRRSRSTGIRPIPATRSCAGSSRRPDTTSRGRMRVHRGHHRGRLPGDHLLERSCSGSFTPSSPAGRCPMPATGGQCTHE